jgi:membrane protease YdiL (CAAX protease family)
LVPGYFLLPAVLGRRDGARLAASQAVYSTAALFASIHPWPTPVALFVLGLGLGWLAYRTQSLVGPMVLHALFNAVACLSAWRGGAI